MQPVASDLVCASSRNEYGCIYEWIERHAVPHCGEYCVHLEGIVCFQPVHNMQPNRGHSKAMEVGYTASQLPQGTTSSQSMKQNKHKEKESRLELKCSVL